MNYKLLSLAVAAALASSCSNDEAVEINPDVPGNAIRFVPSVGHASRATVTTLANLGDFGVIARSLDHNYQFYESFLIGSHAVGSDNVDLITPDVAVRHESTTTTNEEEGYWVLANDKKVYWPNGVKRVLFWAATTLNKRGIGEQSTTNMLDGHGNAKFIWRGDGPVIVDFSPKTADKSESVTSYMDGAVQKDLVMAFSDVPESTPNKSNINLQFGHLLSKIEIKAKGGNGSRKVKIKGAWIVNAKSNAELDCTVKIIEDPDNPGENKATESHEWKAFKENSQKAYGSLLPEAIELSSTAKTLLSTTTGPAVAADNLMLIPQTINAWNITDKDNTAKGGYILLLCRIELEHTGAIHGSGSGNTTDGAIHIEGGKHYHQEFPVSDTWNENDYGYTCVPVKFEWQPGYSYTYTLSICEASSGAGNYPPDDFWSMAPSFAKAGKPRPNGEEVGKQILYDPISFTVKMKPWADGASWTQGETTDPAQEEEE